MANKDQSTLFDREELSTKTVPLAEKLRPQTLEELLGQTKLIAENSPLRQMIESGEYHSDVKAVMKEADYLHRTQNKRSILFIDEIHRFNKSQQDAFLPYVESGAIILIGATTENPSFEVIPALLSRCTVFVLEPLSKNDLKIILKRGFSELKLEEDEEVINWMAQNAGGDARRVLNDLELVLPYLQKKPHPTKRFRPASGTLLAGKNVGSRGRPSLYCASFDSFCQRRCGFGRSECFGSGNCSKGSGSFYRNA